MTIIGSPSSFFDTLEADFAHHQRWAAASPKRPREIYHRTMFSEHPTKRYWSQMFCSCVQKVPSPGQGRHQCDDTETPRKSSSYPDGTTRRRASLMKFSPEKRKIDPEDGTKSPLTLTTTIVESHEPEWLSEDDDSLDAILLDDDNDAQESTEPKRRKSEEKFAAHLNLEHFQPAEIQVQVLEDPSRPSSKRMLEVRARHQAGPHAEHDDLTGDEYECLEYIKRLSLPGGVAPDELRCRLDAPTGHMIIDAPLGTEASEVQLLKYRRAIPIEIQGQPEPKPQQQQSLNSDLIVIE